MPRALATHGRSGHSAELRRQRRVLAEAMPRMRRAAERTERACEGLVDLLGAEYPRPDQVLAASRALAAVQAEQGGLITSAADAADLAETVRALRTNMDAALGRDAGGAEAARVGGPIDDDRAIADWLDRQVRMEVGYLRSARRKAAGLSRIAAAVVTERQRRRQETLTLLQTSLIGSLLMALGAIQAFQYHVPLPQPLVSPLLWVLAALALVLPPAVTQWPRREDRRAARRRYAAGAALLGAPLGWLIATAAWRLGVGQPAPANRSALAAPVTALLAALVIMALMSPRRRK